MDEVYQMLHVITVEASSKALSKINIDHITSFSLQLENVITSTLRKVAAV